MTPPPRGIKARGGWVAERLNAPDLKSGKGASPSWVRIPPHPPRRALHLILQRNRRDAACVSVERARNIPTMANVLVVDDMPDVAESFAEVVTLFGDTVRIAHDGAQALHEIGLCLPDVVLVDLNMPVLDGFELARTIRERWGRGIRLVAHTAFARAAVINQVTEAGFDSFVSKLARPLDLALAIHGRRGTSDLRAAAPDRRISARSGSTRRRSTDPIANGNHSRESPQLRA